METSCDNHMRRRKTAWRSAAWRWHTTIMLRNSSALEPVRAACWVFVARHETYVKLNGKWFYLYRAIDSDGKTVEFRLSSKRDVGTVEAFFGKTIKSQGSAPRIITLDGYAASHRAVRGMKADDPIPLTRSGAHRIV
jgi:transposase-like protein